jgi:hypothetical protein
MSPGGLHAPGKFEAMEVRFVENLPTGDGCTRDQLHAQARLSAMRSPGVTA